MILEAQIRDSFKVSISKQRKNIKEDYFLETT